MKTVGVVLLGLLLTGGAIFGLTYGSLGMQQFFGPKFEQVRRDIYEESWSYNRGKVEHLNRLRLEYLNSENEGHKSALRSVILNEVAAFDRDRLPADLQQFVRRIER